jgi:hypothetical protein
MEKHPTLALVSCRAHGAAAAAVLSREMELCRQVEHDNKLSVVSIMVEKKKLPTSQDSQGDWVHCPYSPYGSCFLSSDVLWPCVKRSYSRESKCALSESTYYS